jgi:hypothetical protein
LIRRLLLLSLALAAFAPTSAGATQVVNGGFETGDFRGWDGQGSTGTGDWFAYTGTEPPIPHERGAVSVQPPPQGAFAAIADQLNPDSLLLYQDLRLEPGSAYKLSLLAYYDTYSALGSPLPDTLSVDEEAIGTKPNQQFRIDLIKPGAAPYSIAPEDLLLNIFRSRDSGPRTMGPTRFVADLAPFAGQTVRLRIAVAATEEVLNAGVDAVSLSSPDGSFPQSSVRRIHPRKPKANPKKGTAILPVQVPEAGRLIASTNSGKAKKSSLKTSHGGIVKLRLRTSAKGRTILERRHKLRVGVTLTWRPLTGGQQKLRVPVIFKLRILEYSRTLPVKCRPRRQQKGREMSNRNRLAVAVVVAACVALAAPVMAQALVWKHNGVNLTKFISLSLPGGENFETELSGEWSGMNCEVKATMTTEGGSSAKITAYEIKSCAKGFGKMSSCSVVAKEAKGLPWTVHVNATNDLTITNMRVRRTFSAGCPVTELDKTMTSVTVTLNTPSKITEMEFSGSATNYKAFGSWTVEGTNSGTYGIG